MTRRLDIGAGGNVTNELGQHIGNVTVTPGRGLHFAQYDGRATIDADALNGLRFELSTLYAVPERAILFDSLWTTIEGKPRCV